MSRLQLPNFACIDRFGRLLHGDEFLPMLITGVAGVAGYNAFAFFRQKYGRQVIGQRPNNNWRLAGEGIVGADLENPKELKELLNHDFKTIVNCGGSCALRGCELDPEMARRVNVESVEMLMRFVPQHVRFVHLSIDLVFSGTRGGGQLEDDPLDPVTIYGKTMKQAEEMILSRFEKACILRISLPMGISFNGHAGAVDWIQSRFKKGKPATLYFDEVRTPVYVECLNETLERVICRPLYGVFHAGGARRLSLYQIAQIVNLVGGYDPNLLHGCYRIEAGPIPPRAGNVSMDSSKLFHVLGGNPFADWPLNPRYIPDSRNWHYNRSMGAKTTNRINSELYFRPRAASQQPSTFCLASDQGKGRNGPFRQIETASVSSYNGDK
jgi:dTDP-4-dehydrorhamnose reductase